jgi:hypothetical protein
MKKQIKKYLAIVSFQVGVNCIGIPVFVNHIIQRNAIQEVSKNNFF